MKRKGASFMHLAIVDDLETDLQSLKNLLCTYLEPRHIIHEISLFTSGEQFLSGFWPGRYDILFLDNQLGGISGMDIAHRVRAQDHFVPIIFITVEESYALEGYSVQAVDYILKPVEKERLFSTMNRLIDSRKFQHFIEIKESRTVRHLLVDDIFYVRSIGHFLEIYTAENSDVIKPYMTLEAFLSLLSPMGEYGDFHQGFRFQNCCRGYIVNLDYVRSLETKDFVLTNGYRIPISRSKYKEMQMAYANYLFKRTRNT
ncbi:MAG: response regulator transcription factor [Lachnospiraceae bacterium]|nr:response regulator transcription factor [Lachnospiraceae bacterium]MCI9593011.1 response regulator transcription factor [Lachnospiraceae bacterium]